MNVGNPELVQGLNDDLAHEYQAVIMYNTFAASVVGPHRREIEGFFRDEIPDELRHAELLGNKIASLGGQLTTQAVKVAVPGDLRGMLEEALEAEKRTIARYVERRQQAEAAGDIGLVNDLEEIISDETKHKEQAEKMLRGDWTSPTGAG